MIPQAQGRGIGGPGSPKAPGPGHGEAPEPGATNGRVSVLHRLTKTPAQTTPTAEDVDQAVDRARTLARHAGRAVQRRLLGTMGWRDHRTATCGYSMEPGRTIRVKDGRARSVGVALCGNGRICQCCGPAQASQRAAEIGAATWRWVTGAPDQHAYLISIAASHQKGDDLETLAGYLLDARADVMNPACAVWKAFRARTGIVDLTWVLEASYGPNGPHPGLHLVVLTDRWWDARDADHVEAWLLLAFRTSMRALGFPGTISASNGVDIRLVDDPAGMGKYLTKFGIGAEVAGEMSKLGRNGVNVPYSAVPSILALELGRRDPVRAGRRDPQVRDLVEAWERFVRFALADRRKWYAGFHRLNGLVPELRDASTRNERIAVCTEVLPEELRPARHDDAEAGEDEDEDPTAGMLAVEPDAWAVAQRAWWAGARLAVAAVANWHCSGAPLELVACWLAEDQGIEHAALVVAALAGGETAQVGRNQWTVRLDETIQTDGLTGPPRDLAPDRSNRVTGLQP